MLASEITIGTVPLLDTRVVTRQPVPSAMPLPLPEISAPGMEPSAPPASAAVLPPAYSDLRMYYTLTYSKRIKV